MDIIYIFVQSNINTELTKKNKDNNYPVVNKLYDYTW